MFHLIRRVLLKDVSRIRFNSLTSNLRTLNNLKCTTKSISFSRCVSSSTSQGSQSLPLAKSDDRSLLGNKSLFTVEQQFRNLDDQIKRRGRILRKDIEGIFEEVKKTGSNGIHSLYLIRCCGSLLPTESPETRMTLVTSIWNTLKETGDLDIRHYNALLAVYLQNNHKFNPMEFLQQLQEKGLEPNQATYQHLIARYCQEGDMEGAGNILGYMKEKGIAITEAALNSLITGHARANDLESAKGVFGVMRQANMEPTRATYTALFCGMAEKGDMESLRQTLEEAKKKEVFLSSQNILDIVEALAKSGHTPQIKEMLGELQPSLGLQQQATNTMLTLTQAGHPEAAILVMLRMQQMYDNINGMAHSLLNHMAETGVPTRLMLKLCDELELQPSSLHLLVESLYISGRFLDAPPILESLVQQGHEVRNHYFWPMLAVAADEGYTEGLLKTLELMLQLRCKPSLETWVDYAARGDPPLEKLQELGLLTHIAFSGLLQHALRNNDVPKARELVAHPLRSPSLAAERQMSLSISQALRNGAKEGLVDLVMDLILLASKEWPSHLVLKLAQTGHQEFLLAELLPRLEAENIKILPEVKTQLKQLLSSPKAAEIINRIDEDLEADIMGEGVDGAVTRQRRVQELTQLKDKSEDDLEQQLTYNKEKGFPTRKVISQLILSCAKNKNIKRMEELLAELPNPPIYIYAAVIETYAFKNMLDKALKCKEEMKAAYPDVPIHAHKLFRLARLMVNQDQVQEAVEMLKKEATVEHPVVKAEEHIGQLLRSLAIKGLVEETKELFNVLVEERGLCKVTGRVVAPLVQCHLARNDLDKALEVFLECGEKYRLSPMCSQLFNELIAREDTEKLQTVVEACSKSHGERDTLQTLALAFLERGQPKKAARILETRGLRANNQLLQRTCEHYLAVDKLEVLEKLVEVSESLFDLDKPMLYDMIIKGCAARSDHQRALDTWNKMQEELLLPLPETMVTLADLLEANGQPVPFTRPEVYQKHEPTVAKPQVRTLTIPQNEAPTRKPLLEAIESNSMEELVKGDNYHELLEEMLKWSQAPRKAVRYMLKALADMGKVEDITRLSQVFHGKEYRGLNYLGLAYLNSGRHLEFLEEVEAGKISKLPAVFLMELLNRQPEMEPRVKALADKTDEPMILYNALLTHYLLNQRYEEAHQLVQEHLSEGNLFTKRLVSKANATVDVELSRHLVSLVSQHSTPDVNKVHIYNVHLKNLALTGALPEALQVFGEASHLPLHSNPLSILVTKLEEAGMEVPSTLRNKLEEAKASGTNSSGSDEN